MALLLFNVFAAIIEKVDLDFEGNGLLDLALTSIILESTVFKLINFPWIINNEKATQERMSILGISVLQYWET